MKLVRMGSTMNITSLRIIMNLLVCCESCCWRSVRREDCAVSSGSFMVYIEYSSRDVGCVMDGH